MRKRSLLFIVFLLLSCSSHRYTVITPATESLRNFSVLEVEAFTSNITEVDQEALRLIPDQIIEKVGELNKFREVTGKSDATDGVLLVKGTVISYEKGSRAKRYFVGFGSGKGYVTIQCTMLNKATGQEVFKGNFEGEVATGFFGGGKGTAEKGVASAVRDYFKKNY